MKKEMYEENGIGVSKWSPKVGDQVDISYQGLLKQSGARNVKLHLGYNEAWEDSQYIEMNLSDNIFMVTVPVKKEGMLNFAFTDPVGNWDNNSGANYSISISGIKIPRGVSPMTGPYEKQPAAKRTAKADAVKTDEVAAAPVKKSTRVTVSKTTEKKRKVASPPGPESPLDTQTGGRGQGPAVPIMPEKTAGTVKRGPGRKKKES